jgi:uncharacterized protein
MSFFAKTNPAVSGNPAVDGGSAGGYALPIWDWWLRYDPLRGELRLLDRTRMLGLGVELKHTGRDGRNRAGSVQGGFPNGAASPLNPAFLGIITTRACNLACKYCAFGASHSTAGAMPVSIAQAAVDWMARIVKERGRSVLRVDFFGGEPMQAPEVVAATARRAAERAGELGLVRHLEIATNGCLKEPAVRLLAEEVNHVVLSLDGPEAVHDAHRPLRSGAGSFQTVLRNAQRWGQGPTRLSIRSCVTEATCDSLVQTTEWFCHTLRPAALNFEPLRVTPQSERAGLRPPDPWKFARSFHRAARAAASLGVPTIFAAAAIDQVRSSFCPVGQDVVIVSPDGTANACYLLEEEWRRRNLDLRLGSFRPDGSVEIDSDQVQRVRQLSRDHRDCDSCFCRWSCAGGCHVSMRDSGRRQKREDFCVSTRILTACGLLDRLGLNELTDRLIEDQTALEQLVLQPSDALADLCMEANRHAEVAVVPAKHE